LTEKLGDINKFSTGLLLRNVLKADANGVVDFRDVHESAGTLDDFKQFASKAKTMGKIRRTLTEPITIRINVSA